MTIKPEKTSVRTRIGIIGLGAIGTYTSEVLPAILNTSARITAVCDFDKQKAARTAESLGAISGTIEEVIENSDILLEAASGQAAVEIIEKSLPAGKTVIVMSVAALIGRKDLIELANRSKGRLIVPSGAVGGIDYIKAVRHADITSATLITTKSPAGLKGAPLFDAERIDPDQITAKTTVFEGSVTGAIAGFPKNINVSATLVLAGIPEEKIKVRIICDPAITVNRHEIVLKGSFGDFHAVISNQPLKANPKTSALAALSAVEGVFSTTENFHVGS